MDWKDIVLDLDWAATVKMCLIASPGWSAHLYSQLEPVSKNHIQTLFRTIWAASWQNQHNDLCAQRTLRSAWACAQSDQSSQCAQWVAEDPMFPHADSEDWSDWAQRSFCWFCLEAAHFKLDTNTKLSRGTTKPKPWPMRLGKTQISRGIRPVSLRWPGRMRKPWVEETFSPKARGYPGD